MVSCTRKTGQHISFYSKLSLEFIALKFKANFYSNGKSFHIFTRKEIRNPFLENEKQNIGILMKTFNKVSSFFHKKNTKPELSLTWQDFERIQKLLKTK